MWASVERYCGERPCIPWVASWNGAGGAGLEVGTVLGQSTSQPQCQVDWAKSLETYCKSPSAVAQHSQATRQRKTSSGQCFRDSLAVQSKVHISGQVSEMARPSPSKRACGHLVPAWPGPSEHSVLVT